MLESASNKKYELLFPVAAGIFLLLSWFTGKHPVLHLLFGALSAVSSAVGLRKPLWESLKSLRFFSGPLLPILAGLLAICTGKPAAAALFLLLWLLLPQLVERMRSRWVAQLQRRLEQNPVKSVQPRLQTTPLLVGWEQLLHIYFPYLMVLLAAILSVLTALISGSAERGLQRAASILALGSTASFFSGYVLSDFSAAIRAAEQGVIFSENSLARIQQIKLCCYSVKQPIEVESAAVFLIHGGEEDAEKLMSMAAKTMSVSDFGSANQLYAVRKFPAPNEAKLLKGYGAASRTGDHVLLTGSAELMNKAGIPMLPFRDGEGIVHVGADGKYIGCIDLLMQPLEEANSLLTNAGFYCFWSREETAAKRLPGENVLYLSTQYPDHASPDDLCAVSGGEESSGNIFLLRQGKAGVASMLEHLNNARLHRKTILNASLVAKGFALLLAIFGIFPIWLAAIFEFAMILFGDFCGQKAQYFRGKYGI